MASYESTTSAAPTGPAADVSQNCRTAGQGLWPPRPAAWPEVMTPTEAAQYLRLDEIGRHTPESARRTLNYFRDKGDLKATKYARGVWFLKAELDIFLERKTET